MDIALGMSFFTLSNIQINFVNCHIHQKIYIIAAVFLTIRQVKLVKKKEFVIATLDLEDEIFIIQVASISQNSDIHLS